MSEPRKIAAADVKVGDRIRRINGDLLMEGTVGLIQHDAWYTVGGKPMCMIRAAGEVWLLDRPRPLPIHDGAVIRATYALDPCSLTVLQLQGHRWWAAGFEGEADPANIGDDWVELVPKEQP